MGMGMGAGAGMGQTLSMFDGPAGGGAGGCLSSGGIAVMSLPPGGGGAADGKAKIGAGKPVPAAGADGGLGDLSDLVGGMLLQAKGR